MSSNESAPPLILEVRGSRWLIALYALSWLAVLLALVLGRPPVWLLVVALAVLVDAVLRQWHSLDPTPLRIDGRGRLHLEGLSGRVQTGRSLSHPWLLVLVWRPDGRRRNRRRVLTPDSLAGDGFRRLRRHLDDLSAHT